MFVETAAQALKGIPGWDKSTNISIRSIGNDNTNTSWLVERDGTSFVLRIDSPGTDVLGLNRANEIMVREHASDAGLAPKVIHSDLAGGVLLSEYVEGQAWTSTDILKEQNLLGLARTLRRLYVLPTVGTAFDLRAALEHYAKQLHDDASSKRAEDALSILKTVGTRKHVICHNDLVAGNVVEGEQLWLIDWEYAGVGDPLFDLTVVIEHHDVDGALALKFVEATLGNMDREMARDLSAYREVYRHLVELWTALIEKTS